MGAETAQRKSQIDYSLKMLPMTCILKELKNKNILDERKLRIVINKFLKVRTMTEKTIVGGLAYYNDPAMSLSS